MSKLCKRCRGSGLEPDWVAWGLTIRRERERRGLGVRELARMAECSAAFVSDIEYGRRSGGLAGRKTRRILEILKLDNVEQSQ